MGRLILASLLLLLVGCLPTTHGVSWTNAANLPSDLKIAGTVPVGADAVLVVGHRAPSASAGLLERRTYIARFDGALTVPSEGEVGWIQAAGAAGDRAWAVHARLKPEGEGSTYELLTSADAGVTWTSRGAIPASSLTAVTVEPGGCGWALGVNHLLRSCDEGASWTPIAAPGCCRAIGQPLAAPEPGVALLGGKTLLRTRDGGATWSQLSGDEVLTTDGRWAVGPIDGGVRFGRVTETSVRWAGRVDGELLPDDLVSDGDSVLVRAAPLGTEAGAGTLLIRTVDGGATTDQTVLRGGGPTSRAGLVDPSTAWRVTSTRRLRKGSWK